MVSAEGSGVECAFFSPAYQRRVRRRQVTAVVRSLQNSHWGVSETGLGGSGGLLPNVLLLLKSQEPE